jgi:hypothetical protein
MKERFLLFLKLPANIVRFNNTDIFIVTTILRVSDLIHNTATALNRRGALCTQLSTTFEAYLSNLKAKS